MPTELSPSEEGQAQRKTLPRARLAAWDPRHRRQTPLALLTHAAHDRVPALIPIKDARMAASPFGFFRGAAPVMAYDLSRMPHTTLHTQLCGDAHVQNLGAYTGPDGRLVFDINDFDETTRGPFEWDVKRLATSILLAAGTAHLKPAAARAATEAFLTAYCALLSTLAGMPVLEVARFQVHRLGAVAPISGILAAAQRSTPQHSLQRITEPTKHGHRFRSAPPLLRRLTGKHAAEVLAALPAYVDSLLPERRHFFAQFTPIDVAFKVVGTGSVGLRDYCLYMQGNGPADVLFLQIKQEAPSAWRDYVPPPAIPVLNEGQRTAEGQRAMQLQSDPLLGWTRLDGRDYLVRQLNDHKASLDLTGITAAGLRAYAEVCGELLARGHARSGNARALTAYIGKGPRFTAAILKFAESYARQTEADWKQFRQARPPAKPQVD